LAEHQITGDLQGAAGEIGRFFRHVIIFFMGIVIAIDIGGTQLRAAIYPLDSTTAITVKRAPTRGFEEGVLGRLTDLIDSVWPKEPVEAISVAAPGPLDPRKGIIIETPNIPAWKGYPLASILSERYHVPAYLGNDANLAVLGEWRYGAGRGHHDIVYLTISTGIGGGVISGDRLIEGARGMATELGHITVLPGGPICSCGVSGHLEAVASGPAIAKYVEDEIARGRETSLRLEKGISARDVSEAAKQGDGLSIEALGRAGRLIGQACADFLHIFNPSILILGGGVTNSGAYLLNPLKESMNRNVMDKSYLDGLELATASLGDDAGLVGALVQAQIRPPEG
jgi:glucokinase